MSHWFHRNPLKATGPQNFDVKMFAHDSEALKIISDMKQSRARLIELLPDPHHTGEQMETALKLYMALLRGFLLQPGSLKHHDTSLLPYSSDDWFLIKPVAIFHYFQERRQQTAS